MAQSRTWSFQDPASSRRANEKFARVVDVGVYAGYFPRLGLATNRIDLIRGNDAIQELVTSEGVKVQETDDLLGIVQFTNPSTSGLTRFDLVVCEYQRTPDNSIPAIYKVVQGTAAAANAVPVLPKPQNQFQVPIAYVQIRPITPSGIGPATVVLDQTDLRQIGLGQDVSAPNEMVPLKPIFDPTAPLRDRLYVFPGLFPSIDNSTIIDFRGGYSTGALDIPSPVPIGQRKIWVYGITDAGQIVPTEELTNATDLPTDVEAAIPLCVVTFLNPTGDPFITDIRDVRQFVTRLGGSFSEDVQWAAMLDGTIFEEMVYDPFRNLDALQPNTLVQRDGSGVTSPATGVTVTLDQGQSALLMTYDGVGPITNPVEFVLGDFLAGNSVSAVREFLAQALHDFPQLLFQYGYSNAISGFSAQTYDLTRNVDAPIVSTVGGSPTALFLRIIIPSSVFSAAFEYRLFSIGALFNINAALASRNVVLNDQKTTAENSVRNLIANPFEYWSYPNDTDFAPDPDQNTVFEMKLSGAVADINSGLYQVGPDGWQPVWTDGGTFVSATAQRIPVAAGYRYQLRLNTDSHGAASMPLEFRVPASKLRMGDAVSFAIDVDSPAQRRTCQISIRFYTRNGSGQLQLLSGDEAFSQISEMGIQRLIVSSESINRRLDANVVAVGFVVYHRQLQVPSSEIFLSNPMAAMGDFPSVLAFSPPIDAKSELSHYVSVHRLQQRGHVSETAEVGLMVPLPAKYFELGPLRVVKVNLTSEQNSVNVSSLIVEMSSRGEDLGATGTTATIGAYRIDTRIIADVKFEVPA